MKPYMSQPRFFKNCRAMEEEEEGRICYIFMIAILHT
jgi:hypothetical protein